jgi:hypothetical protein
MTHLTWFSTPLKNLHPHVNPHHKHPNLQWNPKAPTKDGPSIVGPPPHVQNLIHVGPSRPPNLAGVDLDSNF